MTTQLDHLIIGATDLQQGVEYVQEILGVEIPRGGQHVKMGTHNLLMQLGNESFLEVIAINPEMQPPIQPRWFGLDDPIVRQSLAQGPCLLTWAVNTQNIDRLLQQAIIPMGRSEHITRDQLSWNFAIPEDGRLIAGGQLPYLLQWHTEKHPANFMTDCGCRLKSLTLHHPYADWLESVLQSIQAEHLVTLSPLAANATAYIEAIIDSPKGLVTLCSRT